MPLGIHLGGIAAKAAKVRPLMSQMPKIEQTGKSEINGFGDYLEKRLVSNGFFARLAYRVHDRVPALENILLTVNIISAKLFSLSLFLAPVAADIIPIIAISSLAAILLVSISMVLFKVIKEASKKHEEALKLSKETEAKETSEEAPDLEKDKNIEKVTEPETQVTSVATPRTFFYNAAQTKSKMNFVELTDSEETTPRVCDPLALS